ncbi:LysR family transcriptional regulator [Photobacterium damselae]|uniref:LysR family transcriptional regulator n=1 Tax=Photobacterium damselae TaxID=38293 RepID=UPI0010FDE2FD|nr:LysR family transcriptional regulator [Photobacterium damselae]EJN6959015.1 LysR family transcriptional regulator [Photobacterium damselae]KAB1505895.1 LysR family transcriptional regulator [Photobacterium damselae subsp. damselae]NVH48836.1 LysR family transcriptional regulator [Photobacterium damselae subsp. damselae]TLS76440.1 LysR family transcriptional regulator [Photobacterium damselae subsp. damselae]TLS84212.1 LysR family transcriptional regulator [Photobacterium damselae subsp. dam
MTNNQLFDGIIIFVQVVKSESFSAAAHLLGHSSSHVSKEVNKLENRLGVRLLNRTTRSLSLTPEGEAYFEQCLQLIQGAEDAVSLITHQEASPRGTLRINCPIGFSHQHLQPVLVEYAKRYPNVILDLDLTDKRIDVIADGYDLAIRAAAQLDESSLICKAIYKSCIYTVASPDYLERKGRPYHPFELTNHDCICYSNLKSPYRWEYIDKSNQLINVDVRPRVKTNDGNIELAMTLAGQGICRLPEFYIADNLKTGQLEILFEDLPETEVNVYLLYPSRKHLSPKVRCFIDLIEEMLAK